MASLFSSTRRTSGEALSGSREEHLRRKKGLRGGAGCVGAFFSLFAAMGGLFLFFFARGATQVAAARSWEEVPCEVVSSEVREHSGDDSSTYSIEVTYRYRYDGRDFESSRYQFLGGSSSGRAGKQRVVDRLPPGGPCVCWVDPKNPSEAVIERGLTSTYWFALIPLVFVLVGAGGVFASIWGYAKSETLLAPKNRAWLPTEVAPESMVVGGSLGRVTLAPKMGPLGRFLGISFVTLFWNGIVGVFVAKWLEVRPVGDNDGCLTLLLVPFVVIGLALLLGALPYSFLALFNPRPRLTLERASLPLGSETELSWSFSGWPGRIARLLIVAEGHEEATTRQGKNNRTEKSVFARFTVVDTHDSYRIAEGRALLAIPADTMHSFVGERSKIVWTLKTTGEIGWWPDVTEEAEITVTPSRGAL